MHQKRRDILLAVVISLVIVGMFALYSYWMLTSQSGWAGLDWLWKVDVVILVIAFCFLTAYFYFVLEERGVRKQQQIILEDQRRNKEEIDDAVDKIIMKYQKQ